MEAVLPGGVRALGLSVERFSGSGLPARLERAREALERLEAEGIHFAPVRHHSPACAFAVSALIADVRPTTVLIEGPEEFAALLPDLVSEECVPPVAILSHTVGSSGFFPLAGYSPEWVALREGTAAGARIAFIDLAWRARPDTEHGPDANEEWIAQSMQEERHLAHSRTLAELAKREHCRDHDELWDQLFELRDRHALGDWRNVFSDVFAWSALARLDYEPDVLLAEGSVAREALMFTRIREHRARTQGPILVVTGAFHTLALVEALTGAAEGRLITDAVPGAGYPEPPNTTDSSWLIRYDFRRLDALGGYGAGMPSPGYYERSWQQLRSAGAETTSVAVGVLVDTARAVTSAGTSQLISVPEVAAAVIHAERLADLRGHPHPGRADVLDAITSCFVTDEGPTAALREALREVLAGSALGSVPPSANQPPAVGEARRRVAELRLSVDDSSSRTVTLDVRRSQRHRDRSRYFALMEFLGTGFARRIAGPDFIAGRGLGRLHEEWSYAWSPLVEAELVRVSSEGVTLADIAAGRLRAVELELEESTGRRSAYAAVTVLAQAIVIGLDEHLDRLGSLVERHLETDPDLASLAGAGERLLALWTARTELDIGEGASVLRLIDAVVAPLAYLTPSLAATAPEAEDTAVGTILSVRGLVRELGSAGIDAEAVSRELARVRLDPECAPGVFGALTALAAVDGEVTTAQLAALVSAQLGAGADAERAVRFLAGMMKAAPDLLVHDPELLAVVDGAIRGLAPDAFLAYLPELRRSFSWLKPRETAALAEHVALATGVSATTLEARSAVTGADLDRGIKVERALVDSLTRDGLRAWTGGSDD